MNSIKTTKTLLACSITSALMLGANTAIAEEAQVEKGKMETIEVTANRRAQSIVEVPYNISAVSGEDLANNNVIDSSELLRNVAGITVIDRGYRNSGTVNGVVIRGVNVDSGANGDVALSAVPTVNTYVNDTPLYANFIIKDVEQVEVLRGPQGTLYGSGALAGTVKYRLNRPQLDELSGEVAAEMSTTEGSEGTNWNGDALINIPLGDSLALRANIGKIDNAGVVDYVNVYDLDNVGTPVPQGGDVANGGPIYKSVVDADTVDIEYGRAALLFEPSEDLSFLASYQTQKDKIGGRRQVTKGLDGFGNEYGKYENGAVILEPSEREVRLASLEVDINLGFATLTSSTSHYTHDGHADSDNSGFYAKNGWFKSFYFGSPRPVALADRGYEEKAFVQELRLVSNERVAGFDWIAGAFYMNQDTDAYQNSYMPGFSEWVNANPSVADTADSWGMVRNLDQDFLYRRDQNFIDKALFGELTYHLSDSFRATLGARHFRNEFKNTTEVSLPLYAVTADPTFNNEESDTLFKVNVSFDVTDSTMLYTTISEGYRRGGANAVPLEGTFRERETWQTYKSDSLVNYEAGVKGYLGDKNHNYTASLYLMDWKDPQLNTATPDWGFFAVANGQSAETKGVELELKGYLTDDLSYNIGYTYAKAELTADFLKPSAWWQDSDTSLQAEKGARLPGTPEHAFSMGTEYITTVGNDMDWITGLNVYAQSDSLNYLGESEKYSATLPGFAIVNFNTRLVVDDWNLSLYVKNLLNAEGVTGKITEGHMGTEPSQNFYGNSSKDYISQPRTVGFRASYRF
ncbi:TonB-dependent receptor [Paraferrimonas sp. SM1919]|uniref:TonB-dependent receptor n=1 Tax=Paraferrimonas sp. SM1919 TaxID=2662263 RepID=UPI0013D223D9|nr:TonB-dependent receptor [Paraferrimonas sp. SM1919]